MLSVSLNKTFPSFLPWLQFRDHSIFRIFMISYSSYQQCVAISEIRVAFVMRYLFGLWNMIFSNVSNSLGLSKYDPLSYISFQPVLLDWCKKGHGMCYPVCGMVHIKEPLLLIGNSSPCGISRFPLSLSEWSFTICPMPYNLFCAH